MRITELIPTSGGYFGRAISTRGRRYTFSAFAGSAAYCFREDGAPLADGRAVWRQMQPASAITFPSLTTIYVGSGVTDSSEVASVGIATAFSCSNVSGQSTTLRFLVLDEE